MLHYTEQEQKHLELTKGILDFFNCGKRKKLIVKYYEQDNTNKAKILWGHVTVAEDLTVHEAYIFVCGFTSGKARK